MELVLVRHAQPQWYVDDLHQGNNPPLSELGRAQAELVADVLLKDDFDEIYVSPMLRARQTAAPLLQRLGHPEVIAEWLEEISDPPWSGWHRSSVVQAYEAEEELPFHERWRGLPGGENITSFQNRINEGLEKFLLGYGIEETDHDLHTWRHIHGEESLRVNGPRILLVAHGGTNGVIAARLMGAKRLPMEWDRFWSEHTSIIRFALTVRSRELVFSLRGFDGSHIPEGMRSR
jgi:2,3-bisphosphoglycerate-dependent phosphoglycerate mutase